jgi:hypothetical protein
VPALRVLPNPFRRAATVPGLENERFTIRDAAGRVVETCTGNRVGAGLAPGVYFLGRDAARPGTATRLVKL